MSLKHHRNIKKVLQHIWSNQWGMWITLFLNCFYCEKKYIRPAKTWRPPSVPPMLNRISVQQLTGTGTKALCNEGVCVCVRYCLSVLVSLACIVCFCFTILLNKDFFNSICTEVPEGQRLASFTGNFLIYNVGSFLQREVFLNKLLFFYLKHSFASDLLFTCFTSYWCLVSAQVTLCRGGLKGLSGSSTIWALPWITSPLKLIPQH